MEFLRRKNIKLPLWTHSIFLSPVKTFVLLASVFGLLIVFISPPLTGADEEAHFVRAYGISTGDFRQYDTRLVSTPKSFLKTIGCFQTKTSEPGTMYIYDFTNYGIDTKKSYDCALGLPLNSSDTELVPTTAQFYSPITYVPQVIAVLIGRILEAPIVVMVYMVRVSVLVAYIFLIALAIKLIPVRKWALAGIALLPKPVMGLTNPGGDYLLLGATAIVAAIIIRSIYISRVQLQREDNRLTILLLIAAILMVLPKGIFPGVCLLPLIVFYGGFKYQKFRKILIVLSALIVGTLWQKFGINVDLVNMGSSLNPLHEFPSVFVTTMFTRWVETDFIYTGDGVGNIPVPGNRLGMPSLVITIINILFAIYIFVAYPDKLRAKISKSQITALRYTAIICAGAIIVGSFAALFVGQSHLQNEGAAIRGVNPRYFYPAFIMLAVMPLSRSLFVKREKLMARIIVVGTAICLSTAVLLSIAKYN